MIVSTDVVVIGGGIVGAATCHALARDGHRVTLFEQGAANREGSGTTAGNLHIQAIHTRRPEQSVPVDNIRLLPLQKAASGLWENVEDELEADVELRRHGGFMVAETPEQVAELHEKHHHEHAAGIPSEVLDGHAARDALPLLSDTVAAATWCPLDGYANPLKVTPAWLRSARRLGADLQFFCPVTGLTRRGNSWEVVTPQGRISAAYVVLACGPWIPKVAAMAGIDLALAPVAIQMHITERIPVTLRHLVQHIGEGMSVKQVTAGQLLIGGGWPAAELDLSGRQVPSVQSLVGNLKQSVAILPFLADLKILRMWAGPLAATPDEMPVVGEVPGHEGLLIASGTYSFTFAPLWADVLADLVAGRPPMVEIHDLGPGRLLCDNQNRHRVGGESGTKENAHGNR